MRKFYLITCLSFFFSSMVCAQYTLQVETASYNEIENGTSITNGIVWDEISGEMPLGFDFNLNGSTINTLYLTTGTTESLLFPSQDFTQNLPAICAAVAEYADRSSANIPIGEQGGVSDVSYTTIGNPGERIFILQYKNLGFEEEIWDFDESSDYVNFQIWLYEGSNNIAFHFGPSEISHPQSSFFDVPGPAIGLFTELAFDLNDVFIDFYPEGDSYFILEEDNMPYLTLQTPDEVMNDGDIFYTGVPAENTKFILSAENLGTQNVTADAKFKLLNNPVEEELIFNNIEGVQAVEIYDMGGAKVLSSVPSQTISVASLSKGVYILVLKTYTKDVKIKFIKK